MEKEIEMADQEDRIKAYGEGIVAGFAEAQKIVERLTGGAITLNPPPSVTSLDERRKRKPPKPPKDMKQLG